MASEIKRVLLATKTLKASGGDQVLTLTSLAAGAWRQWTKLDLTGQATKQPVEIEFRIHAGPLSAPTAGGSIEVFFGWSKTDTAGSDNPAGLSGADSDYVGYGAAAADADECKGQLTAASKPLILSADAVVQVSDWSAAHAVKGRYLVGAVRNSCSVNLSATPADHWVEIQVWGYEGQ